MLQVLEDVTVRVAIRRRLATSKFAPISLFALGFMVARGRVQTGMSAICSERRSRRGKREDDIAYLVSIE